MRKQLRLSGSGGQGVITAAIILAEAAVSEGKNAVQSQSYGPEARGGASKSEVIIDDEKIYHPHVKTPDFVLAMTQKAADKYFHDLNPNGTLILDDDLVPTSPAFKNIIRVPPQRRLDGYPVQQQYLRHDGRASLPDDAARQKSHYCALWQRRQTV